jgi:NAD(P)H-flavin reductase
LINMIIIGKQVLADSFDTKINKFEVSAPEISRKAKAGQFVVLMIRENGERVPLTIVDRDEARGVIVLIAQELGFTTRLLGRLNTGDSFYSLVGPLGHPTEITGYGKVILVGGGVGIAEIYPVARAFKEAGNSIVTILGARSKDLLILEKELAEVSEKVCIATDDGSRGKKGFTTDILNELIAAGRYGLVYAVGPIPMMEKVAEATKGFGIKTMVSLNALMVDATGMCGCCRVTIGGEVKFSCVDGPEFDAHLVDWKELTKRNRVYLDKEKHICNLNKL